jgi:hypothetical protein
MEQKDSRFRQFNLIPCLSIFRTLCTARHSGEIPADKHKAEIEILDTMEILELERKENKVLRGSIYQASIGCCAQSVRCYRAGKVQLLD